MIKSITGIAKRFFKENKLIAITSIVGVMISISLIITMVMFVANAKLSLVKELEMMYGKMDIAVGYDVDQGLFIDESLSKVLENEQGTITSSEVYLTHYTIDDILETYYTVGVENDELAKSRYHFTEDILAGEVSINKGLAELLDLKTGEVVSIEGNPYTVKEILSNLEASGHVTDIILLNRESLAKLEYEITGIAKRSDYMMFEVSSSMDIYSLAQAFQNIDSNLRVDIAAENEYIKSNIDLLYQFMIGLSLLVIIITALFIISNFELFLYKYNYELAILRSIGATRWQVFKIILIQSIFINLLGGILAIVFSFITYNYLQKSFENMFSLNAETLHFQFGTALLIAFICMVIIQLILLFPAFKSSRLLPITIMHVNEEIDFSYRGLRKKISFSVLFSSIFLITVGIFFNGIPMFILLGSIGFLLSIIALLPLYLSSWLSMILPFVRKVFGNVSFISIKNTIPQVKKNSFIVLIISSMMIIVVFGSTFIQTIQKSDEEYIQAQYETEIVLTNRLGDTSQIDVKEMTRKIQELKHINTISTQSEQDIAVISETNKDYYFDYSFADISAMKEQGLLNINVSADLSHGVIVKKDFAIEHDIKVGDTLQVSLQYDKEKQGNLQESTIKIADIVESFPYPNEIRDMLIDWNTNSIDSTFKTFERAYIEVNEPVLALEELEGLKEIYPEIQVNSLEQSLQQSKEMSKQRWIIFIVVLVVILLSVMFGVINTLINNINSKRKEFAVLRAIYMKRKNIIQVIMTQVTTYIAFGVLFGVLLGFIFTYLISLVDPGLLSFNFTLIIAMSILVFTISYIILIPFANHLGKLKISTELMQDNK